MVPSEAIIHSSTCCPNAPQNSDRTSIRTLCECFLFKKKKKLFDFMAPSSVRIAFCTHSDLHLNETLLITTFTGGGEMSPLCTIKQQSCLWRRQNLPSILMACMYPWMCVCFTCLRCVLTCRGDRLLGSITPEPPADGAHSVQNMAPIRFQTSFMRHQLFQPRSSYYRCLETSSSALPDLIRASENLFYTLAHKGCSPSIKWSWWSPFDWRSSSSSASLMTDERLIWVG